MSSSKKEAIQDLSYQVERASWALVLFGMLTQMGDFSFPSYNLVLGFWGAFCAFGKHGRATFGLIMFSFLGLILDIIFASTHTSIDSGMFTFCFTMFIFCLFAKVLLVYVASKYFAAIGGAYSMESSQLSESLYESLNTSLTEQKGGYYEDNKNGMADSGTYSV